MALNEEINPRAIFYKEGTQTLNPLDGKPYADDTSLLQHLEPHFWNFGELSSIERSHILGTIGIKGPQTSEFLDYQFTLARMDVRDGKMAKADYAVTRGNAQAIIRRLNEAIIPLEIISDANSLDTALTQIENENTNQSLQFFKYIKDSKYFEDKIPVRDKDNIKKYSSLKKKDCSKDYSKDYFLIQNN